MIIIMILTIITATITQKIKFKKIKYNFKTILIILYIILIFYSNNNHFYY